MICYESVVKIIVDKPKNNIVNILQLYAFTKQKTKKKNPESKTNHNYCSEITVTFLIHYFYIIYIYTHIALTM